MFASVDTFQHHGIDTFEQRGNRIDDFHARFPHILGVLRHVTETFGNVVADAGKSSHHPHAGKLGSRVGFVDGFRENRHVLGVAADDADSQRLGAARATGEQNACQQSDRQAE